VKPAYSSRKEKSSAENDSSTLDDVPAAVREQNHNRKLNSSQKANGSVRVAPRTNQKREALLHEANALLA
jgi:hypothetical protein